MKNTKLHGVADGILVLRSRETCPDGQVAVMVAESNDGTPSVAIPFGRADGGEPLGVMYVALDKAIEIRDAMNTAIEDVRARKAGTSPVQS